MSARVNHRRAGSTKSRWIGNSHSTPAMLASERDRARARDRERLTDLEALWDGRLTADEYAARGKRRAAEAAADRDAALNR